MTDLVERLRARLRPDGTLSLDTDLILDIDEAATALEAKDKELAALRAKPPLLDAQSIPRVDALIKTLEARAETAERRVAELESYAHDIGLVAGHKDIMSWPVISTVDRLKNRAETAERERDEAREALKPFTHIPLAYTDDIDDSATVFEYEGGAITLGDLRYAARAITGEKQ